AAAVLASRRDSTVLRARVRTRSRRPLMMSPSRSRPYPHAHGAHAAMLAAVLTLAMAASPSRGATAPEPVKPVAFDLKLFKGLAFRALGPANMGGRISDFAAVESEPGTFYVGTGTGGLFK